MSVLPPVIEKLTADEIATCQGDLVALLRDAVDNGASVSFLAPLPVQSAIDYWGKVREDVAGGERFVLAAREDGRVVGSVQLALASQPNAAHRAEVQKLLVHSDFRRRGIGVALMTEIERVAREAKRTLLVLDTQQGSAAEVLYEKHGYLRAGVIPDFALGSAGNLHNTVIFYRQL